MKLFLSAILLLSSLTAFTETSLAVDLQQATNQQILDELAYRLRTGSGGSSRATANYFCDSSTYLKISVVGPTGSESAKQVYTGDSSFCNQQVAVLNANRSRFQGTTVIAVCDASTYLQRYSVTADGVLRDLSSTYVGDQNNCVNQARTINSN